MYGTKKNKEERNSLVEVVLLGPIKSQRSASVNFDCFCGTCNYLYTRCFLSAMSMSISKFVISWKDKFDSWKSPSDTHSNKHLLQADIALREEQSPALNRSANQPQSH